MHLCNSFVLRMLQEYFAKDAYLACKRALVTLQKGIF